MQILRQWARRRVIRAWLSRAFELRMEHKELRPMSYWLGQTKHQFRRSR